MNHEHLPMGRTEREPVTSYDLASAVNHAKKNERKMWFRLRGDQNHLYEVWPGGRNIAWPIDILERRRKRQEPLPIDHKCKHVWETHTDTFLCAAGSHVEQWKQCLKCGQVRDDYMNRKALPQIRL
jgi:hypothetical protein